MMNEEITCALVDERDLDTRYLAGRLTEEEAGAFEAHYFGCDRCWELVRAGAALRAARPTRGAIRRAFPWRQLAMAAGIGLVAIGTWRVIDSRPGSPDVIRGDRDSIALRIEATTPLLRLVWSADPRASSYRLRIFDDEGRLLLQREMTDTTWTATSADSLAPGAGSAARLVEIESYDTLRRPLARSPLTRLKSPGDSI